MFFVLDHHMKTLTSLNPSSFNRLCSSLLHLFDCDMQRIQITFFFSVGAGKAGFLVLEEQVKSSASVPPSYYPNNTEADVTISYSMNQSLNDNTGYSSLGQI